MAQSIIKKHLHNGEYWPIQHEQVKYWSGKLYRVLGWTLEEPWEKVEPAETPLGYFGNEEKGDSTGLLSQDGQEEER